MVRLSRQHAPVQCFGGVELAILLKCCGALEDLLHGVCHGSSFRIGGRASQSRGIVMEMNGTKWKVFVRTLPVRHDQQMDRARNVDVTDVVYWQVEYRDETIRGGYPSRFFLGEFDQTMSLNSRLLAEE